jgi:hypothetical protein
MPRYVIERFFDRITDDDMLAAAVRSDRIAAERFPEIVWEHSHARPSLFGKQFDVVGSPNRYGLPAFYALHAWIWKPNPSGILNAWNPNVACDGS